jgi:hypothetical protein
MHAETFIGQAFALKILKNRDCFPPSPKGYAKEMGEWATR